ncbi:MAG: hypothetical protein GXY33_06985 [Phycisphaerae bacterium]|nr:hypothetical protein [Phycisphaerae bacterium]
MSLMRLILPRSVVFSFLEVVVFFAIITPLYVILPIYLPSVVWALFAEGVSATAVLLHPFDTVGNYPVWLAVLLGFGYLLLVTAYWMPADDPQQNQTEVRAFIAFVLVALVAIAMVLQARAAVFTHLGDHLFG